MISLLATPLKARIEGNEAWARHNFIIAAQRAGFFHTDTADDLVSATTLTLGSDFSYLELWVISHVKPSAAESHVVQLGVTREKKNSQPACASQQESKVCFFWAGTYVVDLQTVSMALLFLSMFDSHCVPCVNIDTDFEVV